MIIRSLIDRKVLEILEASLVHENRPDYRAATKKLIRKYRDKIGA